MNKNQRTRLFVATRDMENALLRNNNADRELSAELWALRYEVENSCKAIASARQRRRVPSLAVVNG